MIVCLFVWFVYDCFRCYTKPEIDTEDTDSNKNANTFARSIKSRMLMQQVIERVRNNAILTFDYIVMLIVASCIAGGGLATDNAVIVVASMLVSPLMGPVLSCMYFFCLVLFCSQKIAIV